jgi:hypothetical protein
MGELIGGNERIIRAIFGKRCLARLSLILTLVFPFLLCGAALVFTICMETEGLYDYVIWWEGKMVR